jgi:hypothetical protein
MGAVGVSFLGLPVEKSWWGDFLSIYILYVEIKSHVVEMVVIS